jgi:hypothetical protein
MLRPSGSAGRPYGATRSLAEVEGFIGDLLEPHGVAPRSRASA